MEIYKIILLVLLLLVFIYSLLFIYVFSHIHSFSKSMRKRLRALDIILSEKAIQLLAAKERAEALGVEFSEDDSISLRLLSLLKFDKSTYESVTENKQKINRVEKKVSYIALTNKRVNDDLAYGNIKSTLDDLDRNFRRCCVLYNQDLTAYNYWLNIPGIRLWTHLFRLTPAKTIG